MLIHSRRCGRTKNLRVTPPQTPRAQKKNSEMNEKKKKNIRYSEIFNIFYSKHNTGKASTRRLYNIPRGTGEERLRRKRRARAVDVMLLGGRILLR